MIDVTVPADPTGLGRYDPGGRFLRFAESPGALKVVGSLAYLATEGSQVQVIDVSDPTSPLRVGGQDVAGAPRGIELAGNRLYVVGERALDHDEDIGFLQVFSLNQPTNPVPLGVTDVASRAFNVAVSGDYAYVVGEEVALTVVNVSDPALPVPLGQFEADGWAQAVHAGRDRLVLAGEHLGLAALDATDPGYPKLAGRFHLGTGEGEGWDLDVAGDYAYLAHGHAGLRIFRIAERPRIKRMTRTSNQLTLGWDGAPGVRLQRSASLAEPDWRDVEGSEDQSEIQWLIGSGDEFFRLVK